MDPESDCNIYLSFSGIYWYILVHTGMENILYDNLKITRYEVRRKHAVRHLVSPVLTI